MKEKFVMQRYANYLNKCLFVTADEFIKKKYKAYLDKTGQQKGENFFQRMERDKEVRKEKDKVIEQIKER